MDNNNWRPNQGNEPNMDYSDWRGQLQPESRQRIVNEIMDALKRHLPFSGQEGLNELQKIAQRFEEKIFTAATSQSDYLRKISLKMLTMETKSQGNMANNIPSTSNKPPNPASLDSTAQTGQPSGGDWQEEVYQRIKTMKENYLPELNEMYQKIAAKLQQHESLPQQPKSDQLEKLKVFKMMLERIVSFLQVSKNSILPNYKEKLDSYEKQIINFINTNRPRKAMPSMQPGQLPPHNMHSMPQTQSQVTQGQSHENQMNSQMPTSNMQGYVATMQQNNMTSMQHNSMSGVSPQNMMNSMQPVSLVSTVQTGQPSGGDWQEEVYQKIKTMKENYLPELNEMYQKIAAKLQQHESLPQQPKSDQIEKLMVFKMMLERIVSFLLVSKNNILPQYKEKLGSYEKQIINFINTNRPRKAMPSMQPGLFPPPHNMHSLPQTHSQVTQGQSHENQMNSQMQTSNMQGSEAAMQQNNMTSMMHNSAMQQNNMTSMQHNSMSGVSAAPQNMINSMQPGINLDSGQGNATNILRQVPVRSLQQNSVSAPQQTNVNSLSSQEWTR